MFRGCKMHSMTPHPTADLHSLPPIARYRSLATMYSVLFFAFVCVAHSEAAPVARQAGSAGLTVVKVGHLSSSCFLPFGTPPPAGRPD